MPPQTSCGPCTLTFPTRLALRSHIRRSDSHPDCSPCHRSFRDHHALATHLTQGRFHSNLPAATRSARTGKQRRRQRQSEREVVDNPAGDSDSGDFETAEKRMPSGREILVPPQQRWTRAPCPFRRTPRRILPSRRLRALPRPVSAKRLVSAVVLQGAQYLLMLLVMVVFVVVARGYCERFGCGCGYGCYSVVRI